MRAVNLLPEDTGGTGPPLLTTATVGVGGAILLATVTIFLGVFFIQAHSHVSDKRHALDAVQQRIASVQAEASARAAAASSQQASGEGRVAAFDGAASARMPWDNLLDDISRVLPAGSWLSSMTMQGPAAGSATTAASPTTTVTTTGPSTLSVAGVAFSNDIVAQVMRRLALIPAISDVTLQSTSRTDIGTIKAFQFNLSASVSPPQTTPQTEAQ
jgi:Tfp pilus assembly protein PilN